MNSLWQAPVVVVALITWLTGTPTSFADAAQREALRRQLTPKPTRQLTNMNLPASAFIPVPDNDAAQSTTAVTAAGDKAKDDGKDATKDAPKDGKDEKYWRDRYAAAKKQLNDDQSLAAALQNRISSLTTDFVNRDDPAQRARIADDRKQVMEQLDRMQKQITDDQKAIDEIQDDARKQGVPAGWVR